MKPILAPLSLGLACVGLAPSQTTTDLGSCTMFPADKARSWWLAANSKLRACAGTETAPRRTVRERIMSQTAHHFSNRIAKTLAKVVKFQHTMLRLGRGFGDRTSTALLTLSL